MEKANLRFFLEKLSRRRRRILCSAECHRKLHRCLQELPRKSEEEGRIPHTVLREVLRAPPKGVRKGLLRELVDVARAYDGFGDGCVDVQELLDDALQVQPGTHERLRAALPALCLLAWLLVAPAVYIPAAGWHFLDALYFGAMAITSVGTVRLLPEGDGLKFWTAIYLLVGAGLVSWALVCRVIAMVARHEEQMWRSLSPRDNADLLADEGCGGPGGPHALEDLAAGPRGPPEGRGARAAAAEAGAAAASAGGHLKRRSGALAEAKRRLWLWLGAAISIVLFMVLLGALVAHFALDDVPFVDALYWAAATCTTVGHGLAAFEPGPADSTSGQRGLSIAFALIGVPASVAAVLEVGDAALRWRSEKLQASLDRRSLGLDLLIDLDANGRGVSKLEFLCAALMTTDKASAYDLWLILDQFRRLDVEGRGRVGAEQLATLARDADDRLLGGERATDPSKALSASPSRELFYNLSAVRHAVDDRRCEDSWRFMDEDAKQQLFEELYQDLRALRRQLDARDAELVEAARARQAAEQALQQALAHRHGLRGEVLLLQQVKLEQEARVAEEQARREAADKRGAEQERRRADADRRCQEVEARNQEVQRQMGDLRQKLADSEARNKDCEARAKAAEKASEAARERLQTHDVAWRHQADAHGSRVSLQGADAELRREAEFQAAMLEMQALRQTQRSLRQELHSASAAARQPSWHEACVEPAAGCGGYGTAQSSVASRSPDVMFDALDHNREHLTGAASLLPLPEWQQVPWDRPALLHGPRQ